MLAQQPNLHPPRRRAEIRLENIDLAHAAADEGGRRFLFDIGGLQRAYPRDVQAAERLLGERQRPGTDRAHALGRGECDERLTIGRAE